MIGPGNLRTSRAAFGSLLREAAAIVRAGLVNSVVLLLLAAGACISVFLTAGRAAAAEQQVSQRVEQAGSRLIDVEYTSPTGALDAAVVRRLAALSQSAWVIGIGPTSDATNAQLPRDATTVPSRSIVGSPPAPLRLLAGRWPNPGEAVVSVDSQRALGLAQPAGAVSRGGEDLPVVGLFTATGPLARLQSYVLTGTDPADPGGEVTSVYVLVDRVSDVPMMADAIAQLDGASDPLAVSIHQSSDLVDLQRALAGDLGSASRQLSALVLVAAAILVGLAVFSTVRTHRRDFGRRRALGATRGAVTGLVLAQTATPVTAGCLAGGLIGLGVTRLTTGVMLPVSFDMAVAALTLIAALIAAIPAALSAATSDPIRILRVP